MLASICGESYLYDKKEILKEYIEHYKNWTAAHLDSADYTSNMARAAFYAGDIKTALSYWEKQKVYPNDRPWRYLNHIGRIGVCHAMLGNIEKAEAQLALLQGYDNSNLRLPEDIYNQVRILAALGRSEEAVRNLKLAEEKGIYFLPWRYGKVDLFLKPLLGNPAFEELMRLRG